MDPNANLKEQREIIASVQDQDWESLTSAQLQEWVAKGVRLAELTQALDEWLSKGGFLPEQWENRNPLGRL